MNCADYQDLISVDLDGELAPAPAQQLRAHLAACARCRQVVEDYKVNRILMQAMEPRKAPADALQRLQGRIAGRQWPAPAPRVARRRPTFARVLQGVTRTLRTVACLAVVFVAALAWLGWTDPDVPEPVERVQHQVSVRPRVLMRGHAYLQAANPVADRSAWHYLASEDEYALPSGDDDEESYSPSFDSSRGM